MRYARSTVNSLPRPPPFQRRKVNKHPLPRPLPLPSILILHQKLTWTDQLWFIQDQEFHIAFGLRAHNLQRRALNFFKFML